MCCGLIVAASLLVIGHASRSGSNRRPGWLGVVWFCGLTMLLPELFVIRPETPSAALFIAAVAIWCAGGESRNWMIMTAGALAGAACYSSPRFLMLGGLFILLGLQTRARWMLLVSGAVAFVAVYTIVSGHPLSTVWFNLRFSSFLQSIGDQPQGRIREFWLQLALLAWAPLAVLLMMNPTSERRRATGLLAYLVLVFATCDYLAGLFRYSQAYAPAVTAVSVVAAWTGAQLGSTSKPNFAASALTLAIVASGFVSLRPVVPAFDFIEWVQARGALAAAIPSGERLCCLPSTAPSQRMMLHSTAARSGMGRTVCAARSGLSNLNSRCRNAIFSKR